MERPHLANSLLGKTAVYSCSYAPELLFPIPRQANRENMHITGSLPFYGADIWNAYEISWLNEKGKPQVAIGEFWIPCTSACIIESKSLKLYLNSFNQAKLSSLEDVRKRIEQDLSRQAKASVQVFLFQPDEWRQKQQIGELAGECLDGLDIEVDGYDYCVQHLSADGEEVEETLFSHLLKSNCEVTGQPDWASLSIRYRGPQIDHAGLLKYVISFRRHTEFHEPCIERIFVDILRRCQPKKLSVAGRFTRRGGLDINPCRSTHPENLTNLRLARQ